VRRELVAAGLAIGLAAAPCAWAARPADAPAPPVVVAVVGEGGGLNVLHSDFRTADGRNPQYPASMPRPVMVSLPRGGSFAAGWAALERGPLGHMRPGVLYGVSGTRLLLVNTGSSPYDALQADAVHATGVADAVTGNRYGTDPHALVVVAFTSGLYADSYRWIAQSSWVDLASTSDYEVATTRDPSQCAAVSPVRAFTAAGHQLFSSAGNTTDQPEPLIAPNGMPQTYIVGGVTSTGQTWTPGQTGETDPFYEFGNVVRPYETGELYSFPAAAPQGFTGTQHFGGTSGATPRTAGWAALLVARARQLVHQTRPAVGVLAAGPTKIARGPLDDGRFTRDELVSLLHEVAVPHTGLADGPQYAVEGYGALNATAIHQALLILDGGKAAPSRPGDDQADSAAHQTRAAIFSHC
jgi:hypothetical protein